MKKFYGWADHLATFLQVISLVCIGLLGLSLIYFMVDELVAIVRLSTLPSTLDNYYVLLEAVVTFFLFFEFIAMVINILRNGGHISVNFLIGLGDCQPWQGARCPVDFLGRLGVDWWDNFINQVLT